MVSGWMVDRVLHRVGLCKTLMIGPTPIGASKNTYYYILIGFIFYANTKTFNF